MQKILAILSLLTILLSVYFLIFQNVYGNGIRNNFGIDYLPPLNLDNTSLSLNVEFQPSMTKSNINEKRSLIFKLIDIDKNITYVPNLYTNNINEIHKYNIDKDHNGKVIRSDENGVIIIKKPNFDSGIYRLKVNVSLSNATTGLNNKDIVLKFDSYLSLGN